MNPNPLLIKNAISGEIPFMKDKTLALYKKYVSNHKVSKLLDSKPGSTETLSAYTLGNNYSTDFVFDQVEVRPNRFFSDNEWVALGLLLRAYSEVEEVNLMHLYNCLCGHENNIVYGHIVKGRTYSLFSATSLPVKIRVEGVNGELILPSLSINSPYIFKYNLEEGEIEKLVKIEIEFTGTNYYHSSLFEGVYSGIKLSELNEPDQIKRTIPQFLRIGEYHPKLVEFFSGTLITDLSDPKLIELSDSKLKQFGNNFKERVINNTQGWFNKDGYLDKKIII